MENINAYLANTTQEDIAASDNQQLFINAKSLPLVTNQGIYHAKVINAYLNDYNGRLKMSLDLFAELEGRPEHKGLLKLYIDVFYTPEGGSPEIARHFINVLSACKCFDEHGRPWANQVEKQANNGDTFTVVENMLNKSFYVAIAHREYNGKSYLNPVAFFDEFKRSPAEALNNKEPVYITKFAYLVPEGKPLKQQEARVNPANTGFAMPMAPSIAPASQPVQFGQQPAPAIQQPVATYQSIQRPAAPMPQQQPAATYQSIQQPAAPVQKPAAPAMQGFNNVPTNGGVSPWGAPPMMPPVGQGFNAGQFGGYSSAAPIPQQQPMAQQAPAPQHAATVQPVQAPAAAAQMQQREMAYMASNNAPINEPALEEEIPF